MGVRIRWIAPALLVAVALVLVVVLFSYSPSPDLPETPTGEGRDDRPAPPPEADRPAALPVLSGAIEGTVTRAGVGVAAKLTLLLHSDLGGRDTRRTSADAAGGFRFECVPPGRHEITAKGGDGVGVRRVVTLHAGVAVTRVELALPAGDLILSGRAVHADGRPFRGVLLAYGSPSADPLVLTTKPDGRFAATGLEAGRYYTRIRSEGIRAEGPGFTLPRDEELLIVVDEGARDFRGRVLSMASGAPVVGAEVVIRGNCPSGRWLNVLTKTDADGAFEAAVPTKGWINLLRVRADGFRPWRLDRLPFTDSIEVRLDRSARLDVRVVAAGGVPVPSVPVTAHYELVWDVSQSDTLLTDEEGRVTFSSIPGNVVRLYARGHGWITDFRDMPRDRRLLFLEPGEVKEITLVVARSALILGRVTTASGEPVDGASIRYATASITGATSIDPGGEFALEDLRPGDFTVQAYRRKLRGKEVSGTLAPGEVRRVELPLAAGAWVEVSVRARDTGEPIEDALVDVRRRRWGDTDASGRLRSGPFEAGTVVVVVSRWGYLMAEENLELTAGETSTVSITMDRGLSLTGRVAFPDGTPAAGAQVGWYGSGAWESRQVTRCGEDGTFELRGLPLCALQVVASFEDEDGREYECRRTLPAGTSGAILVLEPEDPEPCRTVELLVTDPAGMPVPRADFEVVQKAADGAKLDEDAGAIVAGRAELEVKPAAAEIFLFVYSARRPGGAPLPLGAAEFGPLPAGGDRIEVSLSEELVIAGQVLDPERRGVPLVIVSAGETMAWTKPDGSFRIGRLGPGTVELEVHVPDGLVQVAPTIVPAGTKDVVIELDALVPAVVTVRDPEGSPVKGAWVAVRRGAREVGCGKTNAEGRKRFAELARSAPHRLVVVPTGSDRTLGAVRIDGWSARDTEITLPPGRSIAGRALFPDGTPYDGDEGQIWTWGRARGWEPVGIGEGGAFEERGFGEGRVAMVWIPPEGNPFDEPEVEPGEIEWPVTWFTAGAKDVVFRLPAR